MLTFREVKKRVKVPGFHCHHIIPAEVVEKPAFRTMFNRIGAIGFDFQSFHQNGMYLPCTEENAAAFGLPLHRGPHPLYNQIVCERIAAFERLSPNGQLRQIYDLQKTLRVALRSNALPLRNSQRDPLAPNPAFETIEKAAFDLYGALEPR
jgi:hypothetical protein